jgi:hypothetical protein
MPRLQEEEPLGRRAAALVPVPEAALTPRSATLGMPRVGKGSGAVDVQVDHRMSSPILTESYQPIWRDSDIIQ